MSTTTQRLRPPTLDATQATEFRLPEVNARTYADGIQVSSIRRDMKLVEDEWKRRLDMAVQDKAEETDNWSLLWKMQSAIASVSLNIEHLDQEIADLSGRPNQQSQAVSDALRNARERRLELVEVLRELLQKARVMFDEFKRWTGCGGQVMLPRLRPRLNGFDGLSARLVDWLTLPRTAVLPALDLRRQVMLYGPAGSGKTVLANLAAFDIANRLRLSWIRKAYARGADIEKLQSIPPREFVVVYYVNALNVRNTADPERAARLLRNHLNCLQLEVLQMRRATQQRVSDVRAARAVSPTAPARAPAADGWVQEMDRMGPLVVPAPDPMAILIADDMDSLYLTDQELAQYPRSGRTAAHLAGSLYKRIDDLSPLDRDVPTQQQRQQQQQVSPAPGAGAAPLEAATARTLGARTASIVPPPPPPPPPASPENKAGGGVVDDVVVVRRRRRGGDGAGGVGGVESAIGAVFSEQRLAAEWPDVRVIWGVRYPWKLPPVQLAELDHRQYVDLPNDDLRRSQLQLAIESDLARNLAATMDERAVLRLELDVITRRNQATDAPRKQAILTLLDSDTREGEPDAALYGIEVRLRRAIEKTYDALKSRWGKEPVPPTPTELAARAIRDTQGAAEIQREYLAAVKPVLDTMVDETGMGVSGYCALQTQYRVSFPDVDAFLLAGGRRTDKSALTGRLPYGFTLPELSALYEKWVRQTVSTRLLRSAIDKARAFLIGTSDWASPACAETAEAVRAQSILGAPSTSSGPTDFNLNKWQSRPGNSISEPECKVALGPDLRDSSSNAPVIPLSARFGSHRILPEDAARAFDLFMNRRQTDRTAREVGADYPGFVMYQVFGHANPQRLRPLLPDQISHVCRASRSPIPDLIAAPPPPPPVFVPSPAPTPPSYYPLFQPMRVANLPGPFAPLLIPSPFAARPVYSSTGTGFPGANLSYRAGGAHTPCDRPWRNHTVHPGRRCSTTAAR